MADPVGRTLSEEEFNAVKERVLEGLPKGLTEAEFTRQIGPRMEQALAEAEYARPALQGGAIRRGVEGFGSGLMDMARGVAGALPIPQALGGSGVIEGPVGAVKGLIGAHVDQAQKALAAAGRGRIPEALGHGAAALIPAVGPAAANIGEEIGETGDIARGVGKGLALEAPFAARGALELRAGARPSKAAILTRQAEEAVSQKVLGPANPKYKGQAARIAPEVLRRKMTGDRSQLQQAAVEGMEDAAARIDDAVDAAGGLTAPVPVADVVKHLNKRITDLQDSNGKPLSARAAQRIQHLQDGIFQIKSMGGKVGMATYEDLKKLRDESYQLAEEARGYERMGNPVKSDEGWAARETGSAIRQAFADRSKAGAEANADYSFFRTLHDVLDPTLGRPKSTGLPVGVTGGQRVSGTVVGHMIGGTAGAFILGQVVPMVRNWMASPQWQMISAQHKLQLAKAMKSGDIGWMKSLLVRIGQAAPRTPSGSQVPPEEVQGLPSGLQ